jgi:hypothetical protein
MPRIPRENFGVLMLLDELFIQCTLFEVNVARLEDAADHWIKQARGEDFDRKVPPIDILGWSTVCLSAMAAIRRLMHSGQSRDPLVAQHRRDVLRTFLGVNDRLIFPTCDRLKVPTRAYSSPRGGVRDDRISPAFRFSRSR